MKRIVLAAICLTLSWELPRAQTTGTAPQVSFESDMLEGDPFAFRPKASQLKFYAAPDKNAPAVERTVDPQKPFPIQRARLKVLKPGFGKVLRSEDIPYRHHLTSIGRELYLTREKYHGSTFNDRASLKAGEKLEFLQGLGDHCLIRRQGELIRSDGCKVLQDKVNFAWGSEPPKHELWVQAWKTGTPADGGWVLVDETTGELIHH